MADIPRPADWKERPGWLHLDENEFTEAYYEFVADDDENGLMDLLMGLLFSHQTEGFPGLDEAEMLFGEDGLKERLVALGYDCMKRDEPFHAQLAFEAADDKEGLLALGKWCIDCECTADAGDAYIAAGFEDGIRTVARRLLAEGDREDTSFLAVFGALVLLNPSLEREDRLSLGRVWVADGHGDEKELYTLCLASGFDEGLAMVGRDSLLVDGEELLAIDIDDHDRRVFEEAVRLEIERAQT